VADGRVSARQVREALGARGWSSAFVLTVDARALELLCEDLGSSSENSAFNQITHRVLGVAEQVRYCDRAANTWFDAHKEGFDPMQNPIVRAKRRPDAPPSITRHHALEATRW
jgi:hypothetical protein